MAVPVQQKKKTFKREVAVCCLVYVGAMGVLASSGAYGEAMEVLKVVIYPATAFAAGAFGLDEINKNGSGGMLK